MTNTCKQEQQPKQRRLFTISLCLNLILTGMAACLFLEKPKCLDTPEQMNETRPGSPKLAAAPQLLAATSPALPIHASNRPPWSKIESPDLILLAANLRSFGCPEKTVRDILLAQGRRSLEQLAREWESKEKNHHNEAQNPTARMEQKRVHAAIRAKWADQVNQALGQDLFAEDNSLMENLVDQALLRFFSGPMPEETFSRLGALIARQEAQKQEIKETLDEGLQREEALKKLGQQFRQELARVLPPLELEEFDARTCIGNLLDRFLFEATDLSAWDIRQLALIQAGLRDSFADMNEWFHDSSMTPLQMARFEKAAREFLGGSRYAQLERSKHDEFKSLYELGREFSLPRDAAAQAFDLRQLAATEASNIRSDPSFSDAERADRFLQMQNQAQESALKILGANACSQYLNRGGSWLTNATSL